MNERGSKFTLPSKYLLLILTTVCILLMAITFTTDFIATPLNNIAGFIVVPFQNGVSYVGSWLSDRSEELGELKDVLEENKELKAQIDQLTIENNSLQQEKYELNNLRQLYELDQQYSEYTKVGARVIGKDAGNWFNTFIIDKGSNDGIQVDMNVMAGSGLVGRITYVGPNWSKVISIIDDKSYVSAMVLATADGLTVNGNLELMNDGAINFTQLINTDNKVKAGDKVVTAYISDKYLPGILIGYISTITPDSNNLTSSGTIVPSVDFSHLEEVLIITSLKQQISDSDYNLKQDITEQTTISGNTTISENTTISDNASSMQ